MKIAFVFNRKRTDSLDEAEFDTPETVEAIHRALASGGHEVADVEMTPNAEWIEKLIQAKPDIVFNTAEGYRGVGRETYGPIVFEQLQLPYVGPGPYGCFLTLDKFLTKQMVQQRNVPVAEGFFVTREKELKNVARDVVFPAFVKPNYEGSSKGITKNAICHTVDELMAAGKECLKHFPEGILIERFIPGKDVSVGYIAGLGDEGVLEPFEYRAKGQTDSWVYDYAYKNQLDEQVSVECPAGVSQGVRKRLISQMQECVSALGIVDFGRADFRVTPEGEIFFLEFNAIPSLQPGAGMFVATQRLGLSYEQTIQKIIEAALNRLKIRGRHSRPGRRLRDRIPTVALVYNLKRKAKEDAEYEAEAEFDSPTTVGAISEAIRRQGYDVLALEATRTLAEELLDNEVDVVFNIAEGSGKRTREAQVPAVCDLLGIEHTGSDATCLSITLDKAVTKRMVAAEGIHTPQYRLFNKPLKRWVGPSLAYPVIVKPNQEGTSKGVHEHSVVSDEASLLAAVQSTYERYRSPVLCEEYVEGREFTVGVIGNQALKIIGPMEIVFKPGKSQYPVYSFDAKQDPSPLDNERLTLVCPVPLDPELGRRVHAFARKVFKILGCRDVGRIDFRLDARNQIHFLEINPLPGLSPGFSDLVIMAEKSGWTYDALIKAILMPAIQRWRDLTRPRASRPNRPVEAPRGEPPPPSATSELQKTV